jgi:hypothetical protein
VELSNMHWDALHRTGKNPTAEASFDIGTAKLLGVPTPVESLDAVQNAVNTALAATGISVTMPRVERFTEPTDLVRVTPLLITLRDSQAGKAALGPGLNATREQREQLFVTLADAICDAAGALLVGDIGVSIVSGTGFVTYSIGGAEAISGDFISENPFGAPVAPLTSPVAPAGGFSSPSVVGAAPGAAPAAPGAPSTGGTQTIADVGPLEQLCESVHPVDWPDCSKGAMVPLGLFGVLATAGMAALDWRHQRRRLAAVTALEMPAGAS